MAFLMDAVAIFPRHLRCPKFNVRNLFRSHQPASFSSTHSQTAHNTAETRNKNFKVLNGAVDPSSEQYAKNTAKSKGYFDQYQQLLGYATSGGGPKGIERHTKFNKKLLAWDRAKLLFDDYSQVLEIGTLTGMRMEYGDIPRAGVLLAIGKIHGIYCMVALNDGSVKGGTMFPISVKKNLRSQEVSQQNHIPHIFVVDSGGAFLPLQDNIFPDKDHGGRVFYNLAIMNSMDIPQLSIVVGSCTAGGAYIPLMAQENIIVNKIGSIFLGGPPLVKAALGEEVTTEELGGATLHTTVSGYSEYFAENEEEAFETGREVMGTLNVQPQSYCQTFDDPIYSAEELAGIIPADGQHSLDIYKVLARVVDGSRFHEFKARYGKELVVGFAHIQTHLVGFVANNGPTSEGAMLKGAQFVQLCAQRQIPLIFLQNSWPEDLSVNSEEQAVAVGEKMRAEAKMMQAVACAEVPKITVIIGNSYGMGNYTMGGRAFNPNFLFCWPNAQISISSPQDLARGILNAKGNADNSELSAQVNKEVLQKSSALFAASRLICDDIILPQNTRSTLVKCLEIVNQKVQEKETNYAVFRM